MNFNTLLHGPDAKIFQEIGTKEAIRLVKENEELSKFTTNPTGLSPLAEKFVEFAGQAYSHAMSCFIQSKMFLHPKVFRPQQMDFELLEQMTLNLEFRDYVQPFETVTVELPDGYVKNKQIELYVGERTDWPKLVTIHKSECGLVIMSTRDSGTSIVSMSILKAESIIEDHLVQMKQNLDPKSRELTSHEIEVEQQIIRAALNFCLLVDEVGSRNLGPHNPTHYAKMQRRGESTKNVPLYFELNQHVPLFRIAKDRSELGEPTGRHVSPHHRRGHYRMQNYKDYRKRIRIPAIFVNGHRFLGQNSTYTAE